MYLYLRNTGEMERFSGRLLEQRGLSVTCPEPWDLWTGWFQINVALVNLYFYYYFFLRITSKRTWLWFYIWTEIVILWKKGIRYWLEYFTCHTIIWSKINTACQNKKVIAHYIVVFCGICASRYILYQNILFSFL